MNSTEQTHFENTPLESIYRMSKKTIQEYVREIERNCRYRSAQSYVEGTVLDDRGPLIDLYEACVQQDAHLASVLETVQSQVIGERYMLARINEKGKYVKDIENTKKIQGSQFTKIIRGIIEAKWYGYTVLEILPDINPRTKKLDKVNIIERRNILPNQARVVQRQGEWDKGWDLRSPKYNRNYILINTGNLGLFAATTPLILAKKYTMANYVNFSHTYGQPIIHGKTANESTQDRQRLAQNIANAAQNKILVTGTEDEIDIKTFTMSNSEHIFTSLIQMTNKEVSNLIVGSESMAGATQSYVGSTNAHQDIFRDRIETYRLEIEDVMNEEILPRLVEMGYLPNDGLIFCYSNHIEMNNKDKINCYTMLMEHYEVPADEIEKEFGVIVGKQLNAMEVEERIASSAAAAKNGKQTKTGLSTNDHHIMSDEEYERRYGHPRNASAEVNFLTEE